MMVAHLLSDEAAANHIAAEREAEAIKKKKGKIIRCAKALIFKRGGNAVRDPEGGEGKRTFLKHY